ncbi:MAG: glycosyltransferase, partial [Elusimicrobia bacterium]|nr:glycosyltransferase [Elusimicrobiota bacterium]
QAESAAGNTRRFSRAERAGGLSSAAAAVRVLKADVAQKASAKNAAKALAESEDRTQTLLARLRRDDEHAQAELRAPKNSLRRRQAAAAMSADLKLQAKTLEGMLERFSELKKGLASAAAPEPKLESASAAGPARIQGRRFLAWLNSGVFGPFSLDELVALRGFGLKTLVCPEGYPGTVPGDWRPAGQINDIFEATGRALGSDKDGTLAAALRRDEESSEAGRAVGELEDAFEREDGAKNSLEIITRSKARAEALLVRLRRYDGDLEGVGGQPGRPVRLMQAAAAARMDARLQMEAVGHFIDRLRRFEAEIQVREKARAKKRAGAEPAAAQTVAAEPAQYTFLGRLAAITGKWVLMAFSAFFSLRYLLWRGLYTLNYASDLRLLISVLLLGAEVYGFVSVMLFFMQVLAPKAVKSVPLEGELPGVDLFVTIYNEPLEILEQTLIACKALDYPAAKLRVHVLDDGPRAEVGELAASFGFNHLTRENREHAKAGNLNAGLTRTESEFIMILDVDHVPVRSYLRETLGFFKDPKVAFVQTPHHFYNPDCYQKNLLLEGHVVNEQDLFFQIIQPGKNGANAAIFAGSSAVFRRKALEDIGGFKTDCAIEDMHTGMELHARGWRSVYYNRILSAALSPENFAGYLTQRKRWAKGGVQLFFLDNPLWKKGLSLRQRLYYFSSLLYFFHGWMRLIYLLAPLSFLLASYNPIVASIPMLMWYFIPHYLASHLVFSLLTREYRNPFWSDVYESASSFALSWTAFETLFRPDFLVFHVTPKGLKAAKEKLKWRLVLPHIVLCGLLIAGLIEATYHFMNG